MIIMEVYQRLLFILIHVAENRLYQFWRVVAKLRLVSCGKFILVSFVVSKRAGMAEVHQLNILYDIFNQLSLRIDLHKNVLRPQVSKEYLFVMQLLEYFIQLLGKHLENQIFIQNPSYLVLNLPLENIEKV